VMFSVIRKIQGRKYEPPAPSRNFEANNKHIARVAAHDNVADKDPSVVTLGFGRESFPKLRRLLDEPETEINAASGAVAFSSYIPMAQEKHAEYPEGSAERGELINVIRQKALYALIEMLHDPVHVAETTRHGLVASLNARCMDANPCCREYAVIALGMISEHHLGLQQLYADLSIAVLCGMMNDQDHVTRCNVFLALLKVARTAAGVESILAVPQSFESVVEKCRWDDVEVKNLALELLYALLKVLPEGITQDRLCTAIKAMRALLEEVHAPLRQWSCNNLMVLTISMEGKELAITENVVGLLTKMLEDDESTVRAAAMGALMNITVLNKGKEGVYAAGGIEPMIAMLNHSINEVSLLNVAKTIANVAENPKARVALQGCVQRLRDIAETSENKLLCHNCGVAVETVTWQP